MADPIARNSDVPSEPLALRELLSLAADVVWEMDKEFRFTFMSAAELRGHRIAAAMSYGFRASCAIPMRVDGAVVGALNLYAAEPDAFAGEELALVEKLAADLGFGMDTLRHRKQRAAAEEALRQSEHTLRMLFELLPVGLALCRMDGTLVDVDPAYARIIGRWSSCCRTGCRRTTRRGA